MDARLAVELLRWLRPKGLLGTTGDAAEYGGDSSPSIVVEEGGSCWLVCRERMGMTNILLLLAAPCSAPPPPSAPPCIISAEAGLSASG